MTFDSFESLFVDQLEDLYEAEERLSKALPRMAQAAHNPYLKSALDQHFRETQTQLARLEAVFRLMGRPARGKAGQAMRGLLEEGDEIIGAAGDRDVKDAALIAAAQRVAHYEIAGYGTARAFACRLGRHPAAELLGQTLEEEEGADQTLTRIAEQYINALAATGATDQHR